MKLKVTVDGTVYEVEVEVEDEPQPALGSVFMSGGSFAGAAAPHAAAPPSGAGDDADGVRAPLAGSVSRVEVEAGQAIEPGDVLVVLEAMKMETEVTAPAAGTVTRVAVAAGDTVSGGQLLVEVSAD